jgi:hypothetical protein
VSGSPHSIHLSTIISSIFIPPFYIFS